MSQALDIQRFYDKAYRHEAERLARWRERT